MLLGLLTGECQECRLGQIAQVLWLGFRYLAVFGSLAAFTAYGWLMKAHVATCAYINPVVAVLLGRLLLSEPLSGQTLVGAVVGVGLVVHITSPSAKAG